MSKKWSNYLGFIISVAGAAIGLGNIWKFPYMVGENGGSSFVLLYLFFVIVVGIPLMLAEMVIGKSGQHDPITSFAKLSSTPKTKAFSKLSWMLVITAIAILSFYSVIAGFAVGYIGKSISGSINGASVLEIQNMWSDFISSPLILIGTNITFLLLSLSVVALGIQDGLEKANKILMPLLYLILVVLLIFVSQLPGFYQSIDFMFGFRLQDIDSTVIVAALGHAFFSLAIGAGCLLVYGSYLPKNTRIGSSVSIITIMSIVVAMLAGICIYTIVFSFNLPIEGGPGLMFEILPIAFAKMQHGYLVGTVFFIMLFFAAWTSAISFIEVLVTVCMERYAFSRIRAVCYIGAVTFILGLGTIFSFNFFKEPIIFDRNFFYLITDLATNFLLPLAGIYIAIYAGWIIDSKVLVKQFSFSKDIYYKSWRFLVKFIAPSSIFVVMLYNLVA